MTKFNKKPIIIIWYIILFIVLFFPIGIPLKLAESLEHTISYILTTGWLIEAPNFYWWISVISLYICTGIIFIVLKFLLKFIPNMIYRQILFLLCAIVIIVYIFHAINFFGNYNNYTEIRCKIVLENPPGWHPWSLKSECYNRLAKNQNNEKYCNLIPDLSIKHNCFQDIGNINRDESLCNLITNNNDRKDRCIDRLSKYIPEKKCNTLTWSIDERDLCYLNAIKYEREWNPTLCMMINNPEIRTKCFIIAISSYNNSWFRCDWLVTNIDTFCSTIRNPEISKNCHIVASYNNWFWSKSINNELNYDKDSGKEPDAKIIDKLTYSEVLEKNLGDNNENYWKSLIERCEQGVKQVLENNQKCYTYKEDKDISLCLDDIIDKLINKSN